MKMNDLDTQIHKLNDLKEAYISAPDLDLAADAAKAIDYIINNIKPKNQEEFEKVRKLIKWWQEQASKQIDTLHKEKSQIANKGKKMLNYTKAKNL